MELFLTICVTSLTLGLLYALFATGLGLVLRTSGELNLAHGDSLMLATYVGLGTVHLTSVPTLAVAADVGAAALIGVAGYLTFYGPVARRQRAGAVGASTIGVGFLPALGVALIVRTVATHINPTASEPFPALFAGGKVNLFGDYRLPPAGWWILAAGIVVPIGLWIFLKRGVIGQRIRAVSDEPILARLAGIPVSRTLATTYVIAGAVGGLAGALFAAFIGQVNIALGWQATLNGFVAAVLGGLDWVRGAVIGGLVLGTVESFVSGYVSTRYAEVFTYVLLIGVLLILPDGVLARSKLRRA